MLEDREERALDVAHFAVVGGGVGAQERILL